MFTTSYELWSLDVWGNEKEGFEVNDRSNLSRDFKIDHVDADGPSDNEIRLALVREGHLRARFMIETGGDDLTVYVNLRRNGFPLFELSRNVEASNACPSCSALMINGVYCHEIGCPDAWKGKPVACFECGCDFIPEEKGQRVCPDCAANN